jgi:hypothetical protein
VQKSLFLLLAACISCHALGDESVPVPPESAELAEQSPLKQQFGITLKDDPLSIVSVDDERNKPSEPLPEDHRIYEVNTRTWSSETKRFSFGKKHRIGSLEKLNSLLETEQFRECTIIDFRYKGKDGKAKQIGFMRLTELDVDRKSGLQTDVPFGVAPTIRAK